MATADDKHIAEDVILYDANGNIIRPTEAVKTVSIEVTPDSSRPVFDEAKGYTTVASQGDHKQEYVMAGVVYSSTDSPLQHEPGLFRDEAEYERVVESVVARIRSGEIQSRQPEED